MDRLSIILLFIHQRVGLCSNKSDYTGQNASFTSLCIFFNWGLGSEEDRAGVDPVDGHGDLHAPAGEGPGQEGGGASSPVSLLLQQALAWTHTEHTHHLQGGECELREVISHYTTMWGWGAGRTLEEGWPTCLPSMVVSSTCWPGVKTILWALRPASVLISHWQGGAGEGVAWEGGAPHSLGEGAVPGHISHRLVWLEVLDLRVCLKWTAMRSFFYKAWYYRRCTKRPDSFL